MLSPLTRLLSPAVPPAVQIHNALSPQLGGSAFASLEEIVARLARAKVWGARRCPLRCRGAKNGCRAMQELPSWQSGSPALAPAALPNAQSTPPAAATPCRPQVCKGYPSAREGLLVNARFLLAQFEKLDAASGHKALKFLETDFGKSLAKEVRSGAVLAPVEAAWGASRT